MRRLIFTLLYDRGFFMLSRNFRLQQAGDIQWLFNNYDFAKVSYGLDELMILDVSREKGNTEQFTETLNQIARRCFIPLTAGGRIGDFETAQRYLRAGADKVLLNTAFFTNPELPLHLSRHFGKQCILAGIDYKIDETGEMAIFSHQGQVAEQNSMPAMCEMVQEYGAGEILFQSIDRDGTGNGMDTAALVNLGAQPEVPCILMGGTGKAEHIAEALVDSKVDAVATANLFNFIGDTFLECRKSLVTKGIALPSWNAEDYESLKESCRQR